MVQNMSLDIQNFMLAMLTGPAWCCMNVRIRAPMWAASVTGLAFCAAFMLKTFNTALTDSSTLWISIGYFGAALCFVAGGLMTNTVYMMALAMQQAVGGGGTGTSESLNPRPGASQAWFLQALLSSAMITPKAVAKIETMKKEAIMIAAFPAVLFSAIVIGLFVVFVAGDDPADVTHNSSELGSREPTTPFSGWSTARELLLFVSALVLMIPSAACYCGFRLFIQIPVVVTVDLIEQSTKQLKELESAPRELTQYDGAITSIQNAHELTVRLSALLGPPLLANIGVWTCFVLVWATAAVAPRTTLPPDSMLNTIFPPWGLLLGTNGFVLLGLWPLFEAAQASSACDNLLAATSVLREHPAEADDVPQERVPMVPPDDLVRLDGLQRYAAELNRSQGFGFTLRKHRVTQRHTARTIVRVISLNLVMLCFLNAWDAHSADSTRTVSEYVKLPLWLFYMLLPVVGFFVSILITGMCGVHSCYRYRRRNGFVFGDDLSSPWDDETYREYIHSVH